MTPDAYQKTKAANYDAVIVVLAPDFGSLQYATFLGGAAFDAGRTVFPAADGGLVLTGATDGPGWPTVSAYQSTFAGGAGSWGVGDGVIARLTPK